MDRSDYVVIEAPWGVQVPDFVVGMVEERELRCLDCKAHVTVTCLDEQGEAWDVKVCHDEPCPRLAQVRAGERAAGSG